MKNMTAPMKVKALATAALLSSPVSGTTNAPIAEMPKAIEPVMLMAAILQMISFGLQHHNLSQTAMSAWPLATRKQIEPNASGAQPMLLPAASTHHVGR
jgi:hypothetical protein